MNHREPKHDKERRQINKQHSARCRCPNETAIDQNEFKRKEGAGSYPRWQRSVAFEQRNSAQLRPRPDEKGGNHRTGRRLDEWRDVVNRELDRGLIEAPGQAKRDGHRNCQRVERTGLWGVKHGNSVQFRREKEGYWSCRKNCGDARKATLIVRGNANKRRRFRSPGFSARNPPRGRRL
jgi:hypothetical protein